MIFRLSSFGFFPENTPLHPFSKSTRQPSRSQYTFGEAEAARVAVDFPALAAVVLPVPLAMKGAACGLSAMVNRRKGMALAHRCIEGVVVLIRGLTGMCQRSSEGHPRLPPPAFIFQGDGDRNSPETVTVDAPLLEGLQTRALKQPLLWLRVSGRPPEAQDPARRLRRRPDLLAFFRVLYAGNRLLRELCNSMLGLVQERSSARRTTTTATATTTLVAIQRATRSGL